MSFMLSLILATVRYSVKTFSSIVKNVKLSIMVVLLCCVSLMLSVTHNPFILNVVLLGVILLSVLILSVVMLRSLC